MKMNFILLCSFLILASCASFKEKYSCFPNPQVIQGTKLRYCSVKGANPILYGAIKDGTEEWIVEPVYKYMIGSAGDKLYLKHQDGRLLRYNFQAKKLEPTPYKDIFSFGHTVNTRKYNRLMVHFENGDISQMNYKTGEPLPTRIKDVDYSIVSSTGHNIFPYYEGLTSGVIIRHNVNGRKFYKIYDDFNNEKSGEFPAEDITLAITDAYEANYIFVYHVDKEKDLYWPMIFDANRYYKNPDDVYGLLLHLNEHWTDRSTYDKWAMKVPKLTGHFKVAFKGRDGKPDHLAYGKYFEFTKIKSIVEFDQVIEQARQRKDYLFYDYHWMNAKVAVGDGSIQESKFTILKNENNKYGFGRGSYVDDKSFVFETKEEAINGVRMLEAKAQEFAVKNKKIHESNVLKDQAIRNEFIAADKAEAQKIKDEHAASAARNRAKDKAESDAIWGSVSNQIKGAAQKAKVKGDCVKKNTQTKKDFLDNKQGWYTTGGCD